MSSLLASTDPTNDGPHFVQSSPTSSEPFYLATEMLFDFPDTIIEPDSPPPDLDDIRLLDENVMVFKMSDGTRRPLARRNFRLDAKEYY